jgi:hypothetical protein
MKIGIYTNYKFRFSKIVLMILIGFVGIRIIGDIGLTAVFAAKDSHSVSTTNNCGNGFLASGISCSNNQAAVQGSDNVVTLDSQSRQADPSVNAETNNNADPSQESQNPDQSLAEKPSDNGQGPTDDNAVPERGSLLAPANQLTVVGDPTIRVFPCCDEMPGDSTKDTI